MHTPDKITVLVTSAGRRGELIECFRKDAASLGIPLRVIAAELSPKLSPAAHLADAAYAVPRCTADDYGAALLELCRREIVDLVIPTIDPELRPLAAIRSVFAAQNTRVVISSPEVVAVAGDKGVTARQLHAAGVRVPKTVQLADYLANPGLIDGPVIAKPLSGSSSVGIVRPQNLHELRHLPLGSYIVQELCAGREYTINLFFDRKGHLRCAVPHWRIEVRGGEVSKGRTERLPVLALAAERVAAALPGAGGPICFQAVVGETGEASVFEINARFGGGFPLAHQAGARFTQWLLEETVRGECGANNMWREGITMLRYDQSLFRHD